MIESGKEGQHVFNMINSQESHYRDKPIMRLKNALFRESTVLSVDKVT